MAYNESLAERVRAALARRRGVTERKMFGGICFMVNGNMACGVSGNDLMLRLGEEGATSALEDRNTRPMDFTGKAMKTMVYVTPEGLASDGQLRSWVDRAARFAHSLPPKEARAGKS